MLKPTSLTVINKLYECEDHLADLIQEFRDVEEMELALYVETLKLQVRLRRLKLETL